MNKLKYFETYGGTALGLKIAEQLANTITSISVANYDIILLKQLLQKNFEDIELVNTRGKNVLYKLSGLEEDFSIKAARGINSSRNNPMFTVEKENFENLIFNNKQLLDKSIEYKSVILQEYINTGYFFISQISKDRCVIEISFRDGKVLLISENGNTNIEATLDRRSVNDLVKEINVDRIFDIHNKIFEINSFDTNIEGFIKNENITIVQLRETPHDIIVSNTDIFKHNDFYITNFTLGIFEAMGEIMGMYDNRIYDSSNPIVVIEANIIPWNVPEIRELMLCKEVVFLTSTSGFKLSHAPNDIPPHGVLRDKYNYMYIPTNISDPLIGLSCVVKGNGNKATFNWK